jgi:hypothetical protein
MGSPCFLCGLFTGYIARTSAGSQCSYGIVPAGSYQIVSDDKGCHKSWLQQLEPGSSEDTVRRLGKYYSELRV